MSFGIRSLGFFIFGLALLVGCAGLVHRRNDEAIAKIKKVAIVGFTVEEPAPNKIGLNLNSGDVHAARGIGGAFKRHPTVDRLYEDLVHSFGQKLHWVVVPPSKMKATPGYQAAYDSAMKGFHNRMPPGKGQNRFVAEGVMDDQSLRILDTAGRTALIRALKVDGIVTATVNVMINGTTVMGIGSSHPQARLSFEVYREGQSQADWFEGNLEGEESKENVGMFFDTDKLNELMAPSARSAFAKISFGK